jgi:2-polyprenyl-3-methyl-5-hydroxy-6-metoxy-1,4-benzoquinol methylase
MSAQEKEWFESWFDSPYYHILYKDRDDKEAQVFLDNLISFLHPKPDAKILDVACGKGRHSIHLHSKGFSVTGFDLSRESIEHVRKYEDETLSFFVHDMREVFRKSEFDIVFNLFSSFGYFDDHSHNEKVICANATALKEGGSLVIDYMNSKKIARNLVAEDIKVCRGIKFLQRRKIDSGKIIKNISFSCGEKDFRFEEHLQLYSLEDFERMFSKNNLAITNIFGDYNLNAFHEINSDRLILIAKKKTSNNKTTD